MLYKEYQDPGNLRILSLQNTAALLPTLICLLVIWKYQRKISPNGTKKEFHISQFFYRGGCSNKCTAAGNASKLFNKLLWLCTSGFPNVTDSAQEPVSDKIIGPNKEALVEFPWAKLHRMINHHEVPLAWRTSLNLWTAQL